jgi:flagellar basal-body rod protein FlgC
MEAIDISASGLKAQRIRMNSIASNIANLNTTRTDEGGPYKRQIAILSSRKERAVFRDVLEEAKGRLHTTWPAHLNPIKADYPRHPFSGVEANVQADQSPPKMVFDPTHPDADANGYVAYPNVNIVQEMVNMISSSRAYEANVTAINAVKTMARRAMEI